MVKLTKNIIKIHNVETNEIVEREMTDDELLAWQADQEAQAIAKANSQAEAEAKAIAKAAILDRIGLTADELKTILG
jgi:phosphopantetheinyl transferase (holo-ACP synthase)